MRWAANHSESMDSKPEAAEWVRQMRKHRELTGAYRPQDIARVLGDQSQGVSVAPSGRRDSLVKGPNSTKGRD